MIILSDDIIFRKAVIHLLNVELGKFAPAQDLFMMQPDVIELVRKQVCYLFNSDELKAAGEITFDGLIPDTYTITETKTKEGKTLLREPITATIPLTMSQAEVDKQNVDTSKAIRDGNTYYFYHLTYEVSNDARLDLPKTGGWTDYLPLAGGVILILGGLFMYYRKKRRKM